MPPALDPSRFLQAQDAFYDDVRAELASGQKRSHWMWFVFPQLSALGRSETARYYGLHDGVQARDYAAHPVLGVRLQECTELVLAIENRTVREIFGTPDDLKLCSCMTLFEATTARPVFTRALERLFGCQRDRLTLSLLQGSGGP